MSISPAKIPKFQALKRYGTQFSLDMTLEIRFKSKDIVGTDLIFQGRCYIGQVLGIPSFVTIGLFVRELFSENPKGVHQPPVPAMVKY